MKLEIPDKELDLIVHDLVNIAKFMQDTSLYFDEFGMLENKKKLLEIRETLLKYTKD